jgi:hypothetical protein
MSFRSCGLCYCNLSAEKNNFSLGAVLLSCLVSEVQKPSSPVFEPRTDFGDCGLCSCNLLAKINKFRLGTVLLSCLVSELQKPPSPGLELRTIFRSFSRSKISSWSHRISMPSSVQIGVSVIEL